LICHMWPWQKRCGQVSTSQICKNDHPEQSQTQDICKILFRTQVWEIWKFENIAKNPKKILKNAKNSCDQDHIRIMMPSSAKLKIIAKYYTSNVIYCWMVIPVTTRCIPTQPNHMWHAKPPLAWASN
jgi:hypothetical protein